LFKPDLPKLARLKNDVAEYATNLNSEIRANEILGLYSIPEVEEPKQELFGVRYFFVNGDTLDVVFFYRQTKQAEWILEKIEKTEHITSVLNGLD
jgi:hypothetical protein